MARKAITPKTRFDVFKRDGFRCQYCGAHPPGALLHVDHIVPVATGGGDEQDNLVTACERCNLGKGPRLLSTAPAPLADRAAETAEREAQIRGYAEIMRDRRERVEADCWAVVGTLYPAADVIESARFRSIKMFVEKLGAPAVIEAAEIAAERGPHSDDRLFKYFCGVCWSLIRSNDGEDLRPSNGTGCSNG